MLVLTRRAGEKIRIGDRIVITVVAAGKRQVQIGIEAPSEVSIDREEVRRRKVREVLAPPAAGG